jgi:hypothetical protein
MRYYKVRERIVTCVVSVDLTYKGSCGENTLEKGRSLYLDKGSNQDVSEDQSTLRTQRGACAYCQAQAQFLGRILLEIPPIEHSGKVEVVLWNDRRPGAKRCVLARTSAELRQLDNRDRKLIMNSCEHRLDEDRLPS